MTEADQVAFEKGIIFDSGYQCLPAHLEVLDIQQGQSIVRLTIEEGNSIK